MSDTELTLDLMNAEVHMHGEWHGDGALCGGCKNIVSMGGLRHGGHCPKCGIHLRYRGKLIVCVDFVRTEHRDGCDPKKIFRIYTEKKHERLSSATSNP